MSLILRTGKIWPVVALAYGGFMSCVTFLDRLDHRRFSYSNFCQDPG